MKLSLIAPALLGAIAFSVSARAADVVTNPFPGVRHLHRTTTNPSRNINVLTVDTCAAGIGFRATATGERGKTVSSFGQLVGAQAAVNGDFFGAGFGTDGFAMSGGTLWPGTKDHSYVGQVAFGADRLALVPHEQVLASPEPWMKEIVGGHPTVVANGQVRDNSGDTSLCPVNPRTAVGVSQDKRTIYIAVVDGRATSRVGMTCNELGTFMKSLGAHDALNLDGGGSSTMWVAGKGVVNFPTDGKERTVGNHLALFAKGTGAPGSCMNRPPTGTLDAVDCTGIKGWAQDPNEPAKAVDVHFYIDGPAGSGAKGSSVKAGLKRDDLCKPLGSCEHAFDVPIAAELRDGKPHQVFAYAIDSAGGDNALIAGSPKSFTCEPVPGAPAAPGGGGDTDAGAFTPIEAPLPGDDAGGCSSVRRSAQGGCASAFVLGCLAIGLAARRRRRIEAD